MVENGRKWSQTVANGRSCRKKPQMIQMFQMFQIFEMFQMSQMPEMA